jgi:hypothetical protein
LGTSTEMADETTTGLQGDGTGQPGSETIENPAELDALFDQVAASDTPVETPLETPESGAAAEGETGGAGEGDAGQGAEGAAAADPSTSPNGSPASGEGKSSSAPNASDGASPAPGKDAAPAPEGQAKPAPKAADQAAQKTGKPMTPEEEIRRLKGRVSALSHENDDLKRNRTSTPSTSPAAAPASSGPAKTGSGDGAPKTGLKDKLTQNPKWEQVKKDFPEIAAPIEEALGAIGAEVDTHRADRQQAALDANGALVAQAHPLAGQVVRTKEWQDWMKSQPSYVRDTINRNASGIFEPDAAIDIFNRFSADTGISTQATKPTPANGGGGSPSNSDAATLAARNVRKGSAVAVTQGGGGRPTQHLPDDPDKLFDHLASQPKNGQRAA